MRESSIQYDPHIRNVLAGVLTKSSERMVAEDKTDDAHMDQAKSAITKLLNKMVDMRSDEYEITSYNSKENFDLALKRLCPIWPIC